MSLFNKELLILQIQAYFEKNKTNLNDSVSEDIIDIIENNYYPSRGIVKYIGNDERLENFKDFLKDAIKKAEEKDTISLTSIHDEYMEVLYFVPKDKPEIVKEIMLRRLQEEMEEDEPSTSFQLKTRTVNILEDNIPELCSPLITEISQLDN